MITGEDMNHSRRACAGAVFLAGLLVLVSACGVNATKEASDLQTVEKQALAGDVSAQYRLGDAYQLGLLGAEKNPTKAVEWYKKAAGQGHIKAMNNLGYAYAEGCGVAKDPTLAVAWYRRSADQGDATAQRTLGMLYSLGNGVEKDDRQAVEWCRKAAEQGEPRAQYFLGCAFQNGQGVPKDAATAYMWFNLAATNGNPLAKSERDALEKEMSRSAIDEGQRMTREWMGKHKQNAAGTR
jgi:TPR repeat protein